MNKIWALLNKLRGKVDFVDLVKLFYYTVFIKYISFIKVLENNTDGRITAEEEKFTLRYLSITYGKLTTREELIDYVRQFEVSKIGETFVSEEIAKLLYPIPDEDVMAIFSAVDELALEENKEYYEIGKAIIARMVSHYGKRSAEFSTNHSLAKLEAKLLDCQDGMSVYDACCGTGISLCESVPKMGTAYIQDIDNRIIPMACVLSFYKGIDISGIKCGNSLLNPIALGEQYDRVIMEPPYSYKIMPDDAMLIEKENCLFNAGSDGDMAFLGHAVSKINKNGKAVVLSPAGVMFRSGRAEECRKELLENKNIEAVIELPAGVIPNTTISTALFILCRDKVNTDVFMLNATTYFEKTGPRSYIISEEKIEEIFTLYNEKKVVEGISANVSLQDIANNGYNLCTLQYVLTKPEATIEVANTKTLLDNAMDLENEFLILNQKLNAVRQRFI